MVISLLGTRGSIPVSGPGFAKYQGATGCVRIIAGDQEIYLDAGSGIVNSTVAKDSNISILLSHVHLDHLIGLPFFDGLYQKNRTVSIYYKKRDGIDIKDIFDRIYSPPVWPLGIFDFPANVSNIEMPDEFDLGSVHISTFEGNHPGGITIFRVTYLGKSLVYASDYEHNAAYDDKLIEFVKGTDVLLYDGQYTDEEYESCRGYGHSTATRGMSIAEAAGVGALYIIHHAPDHTDEMLDALEAQNKKIYKNISYAKCGQEILL